MTDLNQKHRKMSLVTSDMRSCGTVVHSLQLEMHLTFFLAQRTGTTTVVPVEW